jgi:WD40 repeat protein
VAPTYWAFDRRRTATLWDVPTGRQISAFETGSAAITADGQTLALAGKFGVLEAGQWRVVGGRVRGGMDLRGRDEGVTLWDVARGQVRRILPLGQTQEGDRVSCLMFAPDGQTLACVVGPLGYSYNSRWIVKIWDVATGEERGSFKNAFQVQSLTFTPDGKTLAFCDQQGWIIWDVTPGQEGAHHHRHINGKDSCLAFTTDGRTLAIPASLREVAWDETKGQQQGTLAGHAGPGAFTPDGQTFASGGESGVMLWDVATGQDRATLKGNTGLPVTSVTFSRDGKTLVSASGGTVQFWGAPLWCAKAPVPETPKPGVKYYVQSNVSRLFLSVDGGSKDDGGRVTQAVANPEQTWELLPAEHEGYYYIRSSVSGLHLDVFSGNAAEGQKVVQAKPNPDQVWSLFPAEKKGYFYVKTRLTRGQDLFLDVRGADMRVGADVCVAKKNQAQIWAFCPK